MKMYIKRQQATYKFYILLMKFDIKLQCAMLQFYILLMKMYTKRQCATLQFYILLVKMYIKRQCVRIHFGSSHFGSSLILGQVLSQPPDPLGSCIHPVLPVYYSHMATDGSSAAASGAGGNVRAAAAALESAKRGRIDQNPRRASDKDGTVKRSELDELFNKYKGELTQTMEASIDKSVNALKDSLRASVLRTLPASFADWMERIKNAFNSQRETFNNFAPFSRKPESRWINSSVRSRAFSLGYRLRNSSKSPVGRYSEKTSIWNLTYRFFESTSTEKGKHLRLRSKLPLKSCSRLRRVLGNSRSQEPKLAVTLPSTSRGPTVWAHAMLRSAWTTYVTTIGPKHTRTPLTEVECGCTMA